MVFKKKIVGIQCESWDLQGHSIALRINLGSQASVIVSMGTRGHVTTADCLITSHLWRFTCFETTMKLP